jgi:ribonuclease D
MSSEPTEFPLVTDSLSLDDVLRRLAGANLIALDTEFIRERTYYPELCVLQLATDEIVAAVDCLADLDLDRVFEALTTPGTTWLLHSARQDLELLLDRGTGRPAGLIDTQIAAALLGRPLQIGLQGLLEETLNVSIGKEHTRTDWSRRPLPDAPLAYALDDVRYLLPAWRALEARLSALGRMAWLEEDCARQLELPLVPEPATLLERTKGAGALRGEHRAAALALLAWRESRAQERNKPRRWILADDHLVDIAAALPRSPAELERVRGLPSRLIANSGRALLDAIRQAPPARDEPQPLAPDKTLVKFLQVEVKARARELGIQPEMLATRRDIAQAASGHWTDAFVSGWRGSILGDLRTRISRDPAP